MQWENEWSIETEYNKHANQWDFYLTNQNVSDILPNLLAPEYI